MSLKKLFITSFAVLIAQQWSMGQTVGGVTTGAALYCDSINSGFISLTAYTGQILYWESSTDNGQNWTSLPNTTSTQSYNKLMRTTSFRAIVKDGLFQQDVSSVSTITVYVPGNAGKLTGGGLYCNDAGSGNITLSGSPGSIIHWQYSLENAPNWKVITNITSILNYTSITENTRYRVVVHTVPGCPDDTTAAIAFIIQPKTVAGTILKSDSLCYGASGDTLRLSGYAGKVLNWFSSKDNGISWLSLPDTAAFISYSTVTQTSWYKATVKNGICPTETTSPAIIALYNSNPASAGDNVTITRHEKINLHGKGNGNPLWSNPEYLSDANSFSPVADPMNTTTYFLTLTDAHGCITKDSVTVNVIIPIPTVITPNGDGVNDFFEIDKINNYTSNSLLIFDRWGKQVYKAAPYENNWNGKSEHGHELPDDLYYFVFDYGNGDQVLTNYILIKR